MPAPLVATGELFTVRLRLHEQRLTGEEFHEILGRRGTDPALRELRRALETDVAALAGRILASARLRARVRWLPGSLDVSAVVVADALPIDSTALLGDLHEVGRQVAVAVHGRISAWLDRPLWAEAERIELGGGLLSARAARAPLVAAADGPAAGWAAATPRERVAYAAVALVVLVAVRASARAAVSATA